MNIGFDAKRVFHNFSGLGNYSRLIISALAHSFPENNHHLFTPSETSSFKYQELQNTFIHLPASSLDKLFPSLWRSRGMVKDLRKERIELYHGLSNELPWGIAKSGIRSIVTVHDLIFKKYPQYYPVLDRRIYDVKSRIACESADHIVAVSHQTRNDIIESYPIRPEKISVIYPIVDPAFFLASTTEQLLQTKLSLHLPDKFILYVGTIEKRKNLFTLVSAFKEISPFTDAKLMVIGKPTVYKSTVMNYLSEHKLHARVIFPENVSNDLLHDIYQLASVFVYPSFYEGFGMPIAEAQALGIPVIASDIAVLKEAGGDAACYVNPADDKAMADAILRILSNEAERNGMIQRGKEYCKHFTSEKIAGDLMSLYHKMMKAR